MATNDKRFNKSVTQEQIYNTATCIGAVVQREARFHLEFANLNLFSKNEDF